jgi:hypothetical protein
VEDEKAAAAAAEKAAQEESATATASTAAEEEKVAAAAAEKAAQETPVLEPEPERQEEAAAQVEADIPAVAAVAKEEATARQAAIAKLAIDLRAQATPSPRPDGGLPDVAEDDGEGVGAILADGGPPDDQDDGEGNRLGSPTELSAAAGAPLARHSARPPALPDRDSPCKRARGNDHVVHVPGAAAAQGDTADVEPKDNDAKWDAQQNWLNSLSGADRRALTAQLAKEGWEELMDKDKMVCHRALQHAVHSLYETSSRICAVESACTFLKFNPCGDQVYYHERETGGTSWLCPDFITIPVPIAAGGRAI